MHRLGSDEWVAGDDGNPTGCNPNGGSADTCSYSGDGDGGTAALSPSNVDSASLLSADGCPARPDAEPDTYAGASGTAGPNGTAFPNTGANGTHAATRESGA